MCEQSVADECIADLAVGNRALSPMTVMSHVTRGSDCVDADDEVAPDSPHSQTLAVGPVCRFFGSVPPIFASGNCRDYPVRDHYSMILA